jgi:hypothetical protein
VAASLAAWAAWPRPGVGHVADSRFNAIAPDLLVGALPLLSRRFFGPARPPHNVRIGQGIAAGVLANGTAALFTSALGTGTTLLTFKSAWLLHVVNHGQHLTATGMYRYEFRAVNGGAGYVLMLMFFPVIGLIMSSLAAAIANPAPSQSSSPPGNGSGPPGPEPEPPGGGPLPPARRRAGGSGPRPCPRVIRRRSQGHPGARWSSARARACCSAW